MMDQSSRAFRATATALRCVLLAGTAIFATPAFAGDCPGNPNALGTSRTLVVDPREHPRIGTIQYAETLPLQDGEVVLTFDDGPLPKYTNQVLDMLAAQCVQATFFVVGDMAKAHPEGVRRIRDAGHTVGTHSQSHPLSMHRMATDQARQQIDSGIAATTAALGEAPAPFFRIPGLLRAENVETYLAGQGLQTWSADFPADDWHKISPEQVHALAMSRLATNGKGILLLHDIQPRTVAALPAILRDLKAGGYRIVHVVPSRPGLPATVTDPQKWRSNPVSERIATRRWPAIPNFTFTSDTRLPAPSTLVATPSSQIAVVGAFDPAKALPRRRSQVDPPAPGLWFTSAKGSDAFPVPARAVFSVADRSFMPAQAAISIARVSTVPAVTATTAAPRNDLPDEIARLISDTTGSVSEDFRLGLLR